MIIQRSLMKNYFKDLQQIYDKHLQDYKDYLAK